MTAVTGPGAARHDRAVAAEQLLAVLYPPPFTVGPGDAPAAPGEVRRSWTAIPSADRPRLLVPSGRVAAARSARRQLTGRRPRTRVARAAIGAALATGALSLLPRTRVTVSGPAGARSIEDLLRELLGLDEVLIAMPVGPARANRKPVLQLIDARGEVLGFAKVGHTDLTAGLVRREADALRRIGSSAPPGLRVPRLLAASLWEGREVLVQEALTVPRQRLLGNRAEERLLGVVADIARIEGRVQPVPWEHHPLRSALGERIAGCGQHRESLRHALDGLDFEGPVPTGSWHGDLNSGNLALVPGPCPVWDWERYETGVPLGFDLLHHALHQAITVDGTPPREAALELVRRAPRRLSPLGVGPHDASSVARAYLLVLATRYLADDQAGAGADLGQVEAWLLPALAADTAGRTS